jgi:hypothetical protein
LSSGQTGLIAVTRLRPALYATLFLNSDIGPALAKAAYLPIGRQVRLLDFLKLSIFFMQIL